MGQRVHGKAAVTTQARPGHAEHAGSGAPCPQGHARWTGVWPGLPRRGWPPSRLTWAGEVAGSLGSVWPVPRAGIPGSECRRVEGLEGGDSGWRQALGTQETSLTHVNGHQLAGCREFRKHRPWLSCGEPCSAMWRGPDLAGRGRLGASIGSPLPSARVSTRDLSGAGSLSQKQRDYNGVSAQEVRTRGVDMAHAHLCLRKDLLESPSWCVGLTIHLKGW